MNRVATVSGLHNKRSDDMTYELDMAMLEIDSLKAEINRLSDELWRSEKYIEMLHKQIEDKANEP